MTDLNRREVNVDMFERYGMHASKCQVTECSSYYLTLIHGTQKLIICAAKTTICVCSNPCRPKQNLCFSILSLSEFITHTENVFNFLHTDLVVL